MTTFSSDEFVNREKELGYVMEQITRLARGDPFASHERVVHFVGPSGIGKTALLHKIEDDLKNDGSVYCLHMSLNSFAKTETRDKSKSFIETLLQYMDLEISRIFDLDKVFANPSESLVRSSSILVRTINLSISDKILVILIDEINTPEREELQEMEEHLLDKLLHDNKRVVLVMAGRYPAMWNDFALRPRQENKFMLSVFDEETTGEQLEKLRLGSALLAGKICVLGGGVPGNNKKLAEYAVGDPPDIPDELQAVQTLLADVKRGIKERFHPIIEAICILPSFSPDDVIPLLEIHPALGGQWDESRIRLVFIDLNKIQVGPGGLTYYDGKKRSWVMDEPTRQLFERELRMRNPDLWKQLHCTAHRMYKIWGEEFNSQPFKDKSAHHQRCLQSVGYNLDDLGNEG